MHLKPKIGLIFITSGWFRDVGLQTASSSVTDEVNSLAEEIVKNLSRFIDPVYHGVLFSEEQARQAADEITQADVKGIILSSLMWCEDQILRATLKQLPKLPILICTFFPTDNLPEFLSFMDVIKGSGSVGTLQMSGMLKREGYRYKTVTGYYKDADLYNEIQDHCLAFAIAQQLKNARCGVLPFRCDQMSTTYVDEFNIRTLYGIELQYLELERVRQEAQKTTNEEITRFLEVIKGQEYIIEIDKNNLYEGSKYALALEKIVSQEKLNMLAMNDVIDEMHKSFGLRPCLTNPALSASGTVISMEADIAAGIAMYILHLFTSKSPFYTEVFSADLEENALLMGHAGYHDSINHDKKYHVKIISDVEYENSDPFTGCCTYFKFKPGPVTIVNSVYNGEKLSWIVSEGYSLEGPPKMEGNCHLFCKLSVPLKTFYRKAIETGASQHFVVVPGHMMKQLEKLCQWLNIDYHPVEQQ